MKKIMSFKEINLLAKSLSKFVTEGDLIALIGDLGTGKTTFTQTFARYLGVLENLKSPTFNYVLEYYSGRLPLYHFDVYRLLEAEEIYEIGFEDYLNNKGILIIEWADIIESELPREYIEIKFKYNDEKSREVEINYVGNEQKEKEMLAYVNFGN